MRLKAAFLVNAGTESLKETNFIKAGHECSKIFFLDKSIIVTILFPTPVSKRVCRGTGRRRREKKSG